MNNVKSQGGWVIFLSLMVAFWLQALPLPDAIDFLRPQWPLLVLLYWAMALPQRPVLLFAWLTGLFHDVLQSSIFGLHAVSYVLIIFLMVRFYQRIRFFSILSQSGVALICVVLHQFVLLWAYRLSDYPVSSLLHWMPALSSALMWPFVYLLLRSLHHKLKVV